MAMQRGNLMTRHARAAAHASATRRHGFPRVAHAHVPPRAFTGRASQPAPSRTPHTAAAHAMLPRPIQFARRQPPHRRLPRPEAARLERRAIQVPYAKIFFLHPAPSGCPSARRAPTLPFLPRPPPTRHFALPSHYVEGIDARGHARPDRQRRRLETDAQRRRAASRRPAAVMRPADAPSI